jgi:putative copper export protein
MILEYLQPDPSALDAATVLLRAALYAATLGAAGAAMFGVLLGHRLAPEDMARLRRLLAGAVVAGLMLSVATLALRVLVLSAGAGVTDAAIWGAVMRSRIGDAFLLRATGLLLILGFLAPVRAADAIAGVGATLVVASYAAMGHSMLFGPRQEIAALVVLHLGCVAYWAGSLPPLRWLAARGDGAAIEAWSRGAVLVVLLLAATGLLLAWYLTVRLDRILDAWHGWALVAKTLIVAGTLALALRHRVSLVPALARGESGAAPALRRSITFEMVVMTLVFWAAAEMVSVHPVDYGHRVPS